MIRWVAVAVAEVKLFHWIWSLRDALYGVACQMHLLWNVKGDVSGSWTGDQFPRVASQILSPTWSRKSRREFGHALSRGERR